jgi:hypothetical protein
MPEYRTCGKCREYSHALARCKRGWANPRQLNNTIDAMRWMGYSYICPYSKWRRKAINKLLEQVGGPVIKEEDIDDFQRPTPTLAASPPRTCVCGAWDEAEEV